jgi:membrane-bound lytic murein transglycosylase A
MALTITSSSPIRTIDMHSSMRLVLFLCLMVLVSCGEEKKPEEKVDLTLQPVLFTDLPDWQKDNLSRFSPAFALTCERVLKAPPEKPFGALVQAGTYGDWQEPCRKFLDLKDAPSPIIRAFFEEHFRPMAVMAGDNPDGLFTGYYEASLRGGRAKSDVNATPLYARPDDLVLVDLGQFRDELKGQRIAGRVENGTLKPYETREEIVAGQWPHSDKVLVWVDNPVDAFFVQIQGSGIVAMDDGSTMRIGYAGQNGHPYFAIGKELIARGALTKDNVSMQSIREWLDANPDEADAVMNINKSYVFFQELMGDGPLGGEGVALTPERSLAIDRSLLAYGLPLWVDIAKPLEGEHGIRRMMVAQDTGGAIRGAVRGDVFWGYGDRAEHMAGHMKSKGRYWILLPKK